jgi:hypothetical protein
MADIMLYMYSINMCACVLYIYEINMCLI